MKHYVYIIQNIINLKIYVGYSCNPKMRWAVEKCTAFNRDDKEYYGPLSCAIRKYGWNNFTKQVIEEFDTKEEALEAEKFWIEYFRTNIKKYGKECGYNLHEGGNVPPSFRGKKHSEETIKKISEKQIGKPKWNDEDKQKMSLDRKGTYNAGSFTKGHGRPTKRIFPDDQILDIVNSKLSQRELAQKYNIGIHSIRRILREYNS